ncbi:MAG TPA: NAD(P)-binding domain-containing protein [Rhodopila sp.]|nr:NAD(P)-binding domain-containing protein [Rhodopila sp.]
MTMTTDVAIIGAGPYGLSLAAHLTARNVDVRVLGSPMQFWRTSMPEGMVLKSEGFASNLWHPDGKLTLKDYCLERGLRYQDSGMPIPLQTFCDYGVAFQRRFVPMLDERPVSLLQRDGHDFVLRLADGACVQAARVVIATGIGSFRFTPAELDPIAGALCSHSTQHRHLDQFVGKDVLVVGGGASGVEMAALMSASGARVTVATRQDRIAFCGPPSRRSLLERIQAPESGLGTGWRSLACVMAPMVFYRMPRDFRHLVVRKHLGPAPGWTSRAEVERNVAVLPGARLQQSGIRDGRACVEFALRDGTQRTVEADHVIAATGFRVDMHRLAFISPPIMRQVDLADETPVLSPYFETSVPGLFTIGVTAANSFGPLLRFAYGAGFASRRLSRHLIQAAIRSVVPADRERIAA